MDDEWLKVAAIDTSDDSMFEDSNYAQNALKFALPILIDEISPLLKEVFEAWFELGLPKQVRDQRFQEFVELFKDVGVKVVDNEKNSVKKVKDIKENKMRELKVLIAELGENDFPMPENLPLLAFTRQYYLKCKELRALKEERVNEWQKLKSKRSQLCLQLGIDGEPHSISYEVPHPDDLLKLGEYVKKLEDNRKAKLSKYATLKRTIKYLMDELEKDSFNDFEKEVIFGETEKFIVSKENLDLVINLHAKLEKEAEENAKKRKELFNRLQALWDRLQEPQINREFFLSSNPGCKPSVLKSFEDEIKRLEIIKKQNMALFIERMRPEIRNWWDKCFIEEAHREYFKDYFEDKDYNEELLEIHEREVERCRNFYEENKTVFTKIESYKKLFEDYTELERKMTDPSRFNNRGGALLKEEAERRRLMKALPKLENDVKGLCRRWTQDHDGKVFTIGGRTVEQFFESLWNAFSASKENERKSRQQQKKLELEAEARGRKLAQKTTPVVVTRKTPVPKARLTPATASRRVTPLSPSNVQNVLKPRNVKAKKDLQSHFPKKTPTPSAKPIVGGKAPPVCNDTYLCEEAVFQTSNVTYRRFKPLHGLAYGKLNKRKSKSCTDMAQLSNKVFPFPVKSPVKQYIHSASSTPQMSGLKRTDTFVKISPIFA